MDKFKIIGGKSLNGEVTISGAKNAALPIILATILTADCVVLHKVPNLIDVKTCVKLLEILGKKVTYLSATSLAIEGAVSNHQAPYELVKTMRASIMALGPLTAYLGQAEVSLPGGCAIGARPVDLHIRGLQEMGANIELIDGYIKAQCPKLKGSLLMLDKVSVTGTENLLIAATLAEGTTIIENAACEPEIVDLGRCLQMMGAKIEGLGTPRIKIEGVASLHGGEHHIVCDRIEAGTYLIAGMASHGLITCHDVDLDTVEPILNKLQKANAHLVIDGTSITLDMRDRLIKPVDIITAPHPGFPTDMQAQFTVLNTQADGFSRVTETIFENRFMHVPELNRMGADINIEGNSVIIKGHTQLSGAQVMATDLRASASLVIAGLIAEGTTIVDRIYHMDRGYECIEEKIRALGGTIERVKA